MLDAPWKVRNGAYSLAVLPAARAQFAVARIPWQEGFRFFGLPILQIYRGSRVRFGPSLVLRSSVRSNPLSPSHPVVISTRARTAALIVGSDFSMTGGSLVAAREIRIGDRVMVGANCIITDTDFHPLDQAERIREPNAGASAPVVIGSDVFIGANSIILKGVTLGKGCVIGAGSVVTRSMPDGAVAAGNPAKVLRLAQGPICV